MWDLALQQQEVGLEAELEVLEELAESYLWPKRQETVEVGKPLDHYFEGPYSAGKRSFAHLLVAVVSAEHSPSPPPCGLKLSAGVAGFWVVLVS